MNTKHTAHDQPIQAQHATDGQPSLATSLLEAIKDADIGSVAWQQAIHNAVVGMLTGAEHEATKHRAK